ncbi:MAG: mucoidy inhibitor MuiA family protein [Bacteroidales bacterium]|nr:mucoidy inhibitor MuiA family protein [Bacteroidales bacterium]
MKIKLIILALLYTVNLYSDEIDTLKLSSQITDVTVFFDGAQITREAKISVLKGKKIFVLENLPAEINPQSIQINNNQKGNIISVKHELVFPNDKSKTLVEYEEKIKLQRIKFQQISNEISVYNIEEQILLDNSILGKKETGTSIAEIKEASIFYRSKLNEIRQNKQKLFLDLDLIEENIQNLYLELNKKVSQEKKTYSKITFTFSSETQINANFMISYYVSSAGWTPLYDFRVNDINKPLNLVYNANIFQSTGEAWNNVNLTLSTNRPSLSNLKPELETWFVERNNNYKKKIIVDGQSALQGSISDNETGEPIPFANVIIFKNGEMITGTTTDFDGRYTIKPIKSGYYDVKVSFVGYENIEMKGVILNSDQVTYQDFKIQSNALLLQEIQIVEYNMPLIDRDQRNSRNKVESKDIARMQARSSNTKAYTLSGVDGLMAKDEVSFIGGYESNTNITSMEYKIDIPYSIPSDGKDYNVKIKELNVPVNYRYSCVPKLDKDVFLIAEINNWAKLNLLSGKSSIYYNGIFTGQSEIDARNTEDTLAISLNRDKNIIVERTLLKEKNEKQFIGNNIRETINWNIIVKNNKTVKTKIFIEDQFPISENKSIVIEKLEYLNGKVDEKTGKVIWEIELEPNEKKELILKYSVKYPNSMNLHIE